MQCMQSLAPTNRLSFLPFPDLVDSSSLYNASNRPDPMSIGVFVVVFFFVVLILVISFSFVFYHNQRKAASRRGGGGGESTRKFLPSMINPYLSTGTSSMSGAAVPGAQANQLSNPRAPGHRPLHTRPLQQLPTTAQHISQAAQLLMPSSMPVRHNPPTQPAPQPPSAGVQLAHSYVHQLQKQSQTLSASSVPAVSIVASHRAHPAPLPPPQHSPLSSEIAFRNRSGAGSVLNGSESASVVASRIQMASKGGPSSIFTQNSNENLNDNYSNLMVGAEHYDLENASNIAPSDIDIVYHCKGYRQRDLREKERQAHHAPLARLSPSVSELSAAPRIVTLQDLSPHVPPPPPIRPHHRKTHSQLESVSQEHLDQVAGTENSYSVSEYADNYEICGEPIKDAFSRVW